MISQRNILIIILSFATISCSSFMDSTHKYLFGEEGKSAKETTPPTREEYNELLAKYKNLDEKYQQTLGKTQETPEEFSQADELSSSTPDTVDAFAQDIMNTSPMAAAAVPLTEDEVSQEIKYYKKGVALRMNGNIDSALKVFQYLERSKTAQVRVRAKYHISQIYMQKNNTTLLSKLMKISLKLKASQVKFWQHFKTLLFVRII